MGRSYFAYAVLVMSYLPLFSDEAAELAYDEHYQQDQVEEAQQPGFFATHAFHLLSAHARLAAAAGVSAGVPTDDRQDDAGDDHFVRPLSLFLSIL